MAQPRIVPTPSYCAACYGQYPDRLHIDYAAAIEGRLLDPSKPRGGHVDWVVICEKCLRDGLALVPEQRDQREAEAATLAALRAELAESREYVTTLEAALAAKPREHTHPIVTPAPPAPEPAPAPEQPTPAAPRKSRYAAKAES